MNPLATQRPTTRKVITPKVQPQPTLLPLDLARMEQEANNLKNGADLGTELDAINEAITAAYERRRAFLEREGYIPCTGSYYDTEHWAIHRSIYSLWEQEGPALIGKVPHYLIINL